MAIINSYYKKVEIYLTSIIIVSILMWMGGLGFVYVHITKDANAIDLSNVSDTLSDSDFGVQASHSIGYTASLSLSAGNTISIQFDTAAQGFNLSGLATANITATGMNVTGTCGAPANEILVANINTISDIVRFEVCTGDTISNGAKVINIAAVIVNPAGPTPGSKEIRIVHGTETADTWVAILGDVEMRAVVSSSFSFIVASIASGAAINGDVTTTWADSDPQLFDFATLSAGVAKTLGHQLTVTTNAQNGFVVTIEQNQNLLSETGADIDLFIDGNAVASASVWQSPANTITQENTYGHYGVTSEDSDITITSPDEYGTAQYTGDITTPRQVFSHNGPADGSTLDQGLTKVAVKIEIGALQESAEDYQNYLTYIATPTF